MKKYKNYLYYLLFLLLSILSIILINNEYFTYIIYSYVVIIGILPSFIGYKYSIHYLKLSFGRTRKDLIINYYKELIKLLIFSVIYILILLLMTYLIYKGSNIYFKTLIFRILYTYLISIFISGCSMITFNLSYKPYLILLTILISLIIIGIIIYLYILNVVIAIIINIIMLIGINIFNYLIIKNMRI